MTLRAPFLAYSEFDEFLFAPIGEEGDAMPVSVISALARLNVDPWQEAIRLAELPKERAIAALGRIIHQLPGYAHEKSDIQALATRLIALLPPRGGPFRPAPVAPGGPGKTQGSRALLWLGFAVLAATAVVAVASTNNVPWRDAPAPISITVVPPATR